MITGLAICLVLAFIVGGTLALAHAITLATTRDDATYDAHRTPGMGDITQETP